MRASRIAKWTWRQPAVQHFAPGFDAPIPDRSILEILGDAARRAPGAPALVGSTQTLTFLETHDIAERVASHIDSQLAPGERLATVLPHNPAGLAILLGCLGTGRVCAVLNARDPAARLAAMLRTAQPALVVTDSGSLECVRDTGLPSITLAEALAAQRVPSRGRLVTSDFDAAAVVHFTSGSSGVPKGIVASRRGLLYRAGVSRRFLELTRTDAVIATSRTSTASGLAFVLAALDAGSRFLVTDLAVEGARVLMDLVQRERASVLIIPPPVFRMLASLDGAAQVFATARILRSGAAGLATEDVASWRTTLPATCRISHTYASTEATIIAEWWLPENIGKYGSVVPAGYLLSGNEYALINTDEQDAGKEELGELVLRGPYIALGELRDGELVTGRMEPDPQRQGWRIFRTGDMMQIDSEGLVRFSGRADRQIKINGIRVEPAEIEAVLRAEPAVSDAVVVARSQPTGMALYGFVTAPGFDPISLRSVLLERLRANLAPALRPSNLSVLESLPTLPGGKIDTAALLSLVGTANG